MKTKDSTMLVEKEAIKERWTEYFEELFNIEEDREADECTSFRSTSLLSVVDQMYGRILLKKIREGTKGVM